MIGVFVCFALGVEMLDKTRLTVLIKRALRRYGVWDWADDAD